MACVPLPWCTSMSTIIRRLAPKACSCRAAMAMLLSRQKPMACVEVAWWPGGRIRAKPELASRPRLSSPPAPRRLPPVEHRHTSLA